MKHPIKTIIGSFLLAASTTVASAEVRSGPVHKLSNDATKVVSVFLSPQVSDCVDQFRRSGAAITSVTEQVLGSGIVEYKMTGPIANSGYSYTPYNGVRGGSGFGFDLWGVMTIEEKKVPSTFSTKIKEYSCTFAITR